MDTIEFAIATADARRPFGLLAGVYVAVTAALVFSFGGTPDEPVAAKAATPAIATPAADVAEEPAMFSIADVTPAESVAAYGV